MSDKIKILVITDGESGCAYFRSMRPHQYIAEHYPDLFEVTIKRHQEIPNFEDAIKPFDIIHIHKQLDPNLNMIDVLKFYDKKIVIDIDDYWDLGTEHPMSAQSKAEKWHIPIINHLKAADMVTTTTEDFKKEIVKYNKNCFVFPNAIDTSDPQFQPIDTPSRRIRFGMICGSSHMVDFELIRGMVNQLPKDVIDKIQFVLCGFDTRGTKTTLMPNGEKKTEPIKPQESVWYEYEKILTDNYKIVSPNHAQFLHMFIPQVEFPDKTEAYRRIWTKDINHYATHYNNIDVLLVPLKDNQFNRMKSDLKVAESGFFHKAIIANSVGPYNIALKPYIGKGGVINEDGNALLVDPSKNHKQWAKYITMLVHHPNMIKDLQERLYNTVKDMYSIETVCKARVDAYLELMGRK